jgi:nicotinamidase/pyrazinamidase
MRLEKHDALIIVDVQNDFLPGGALPVLKGNEIIPVLNNYVKKFTEKKLPVFVTRDWHDPTHPSFKVNGGIWPVHCVQGTSGVEFAKDLELPITMTVISKGRGKGNGYSGFEGIKLRGKLLNLEIERLFIGGLTTDYCVKATVKDALYQYGYPTFYLKDASRAVNINPDDEAKAEDEMTSFGAKIITLKDIE